MACCNNKILYAKQILTKYFHYFGYVTVCLYHYYGYFSSPSLVCDIVILLLKVAVNSDFFLANRKYK